MWQSRLLLALAPMESLLGKAIASSDRANSSRDSCGTRAGDGSIDLPGVKPDFGSKLFHSFQSAEHYADAQPGDAMFSEIEYVPQRSKRKAQESLWRKKPGLSNFVIGGF